MMCPATRCTSLGAHTMVRSTSVLICIVDPRFHLAMLSHKHAVKLTIQIVFAGKDASRALGMTSVKPEDVRPDWHDLPDKEKGVLEDWITFFSKRYNVVGVVEGATNQ